MVTFRYEISLLVFNSKKNPYLRAPCIILFYLPHALDPYWRILALVFVST